MKSTASILGFNMLIFIIVGLNGCYTSSSITTAPSTIPSTVKTPKADSLPKNFIFEYSLVKKDTSSLKVDTLKTLSFEDERISVSFSIDFKEIDFVLKNKTNDVMRILWDDVSFILDGKAQKVMHNGVKYIDRNNSQPPTPIPPQTSIDDMIVPIENVSFKYEQWRTSTLFPIFNPSFDLERHKLILGQKGRMFSIYLPIQHQNKTRDYIFDFVITKVKPIDYNPFN